MNDYDLRLRAVEDATRLVMGFRPPPVTSTAFTVKSVPTADLFDVLEVARFLLDETAPVDIEVSA